MTLTQITKIRGPGIHTTSNIVSHNINSSGIITAVAFKGPFTGSSNIQSGILTATKIDLNGDIDVDGHTNLDNVNVAGVATFASAVNTGALTATTGTFSGNVSIGGTLTYEDVTNIDSVGIITARDGLKVLAGGANIVGVVTATTFKGNGDFVELDVDGHTNLDNVSIAGVTTASGAIDLNADLDVDGHTNLDNVSVAGVTTFSDAVRIVKTAGPLLELTTNTGAADATLRLSEGSTGSTTNGGGMVYSGADNKLHITCGTNSTTKRITINRDDGKIGIGSEIPNSKLEVHNGSNIEVLRLKDTHFNKYLTIRGGGSPNRMVIDSYEGGGGGADIDFASNGSTKVRITSGGVTQITKGTSGGAAANTDAALIVDNSSHTYVQFRTPATKEQGLLFGDDADNDAGGITYVHSTNHLGFRVNADERARIDSSGRLLVGTEVAPASANTLLRVHTPISSSSANSIEIGHNTNGADKAGASLGLAIQNGGASTNAADLYFSTATNGSLTQKLWIRSDGHITPAAAGTQNLGSTSKEWGDVFLASDKALKLGNSQIGDLYVGSDNVTYLRNSTGQMVIRAAGDIYISDYSGNHRAGFRDNSSVDLYYDVENNATAKLSTTAKGISVHGEVAASQDYPTIRPTLDLNFAATKTLDPRITFYRTGPASYTDEFGKVVLVGGNTPRFDHDPTTRECKGFLIEESRINILPYSTDVVGQSGWARAGVLTENTTATKAPDGSYDAIALRDDGSNGQHTLYDDVAVGNITSVYTSSCWAKAGSKNFAELFQNGTGSSGTVTIAYKFNLSTGAATYTGSGGFQSGTSTTATEYPNGWWRLSVTCDVADSASGSGTFRWHVRPREDGSGNYQGNDSIGIYVWGLQLELGTFPTSYIPGSSTGGTATRGADFALIDGEEFTDFFNQDEGTINCAYWLGNDNAGLRIFQINDSNNSVIDIVAGSGGGSGGYGYINTGGTAQANAGQSSANASRLNTLHVTTLAYKANDVAGINIKTGVLTNDTSATLDGAYNRVTFYQHSNSADQLNGHLQRVQYYPKRLPDNQLKNLNNQ